MSVLKRVGLVMLATFLVLIGIDSTNSNTTINKRGEKERPLIGIAMCSLLAERWNKDQEALVGELGRLGADVIIQNANNQQELQNQQIESLIEKGIDVLIIIPVCSTDCRLAIGKAKAAGIKVIAYERLVLQADLDLYISFDNIILGQQMGQGLLEHMTEGNILLINGDPEDQNSEFYKTGYMKVLQPAIDEGRIQIIGEVWAENWTKEIAYEAVEAYLDKGISIQGIIAENDSLAEMAIQALSERGLISETIVIGQDGDLGAYQRIAFGVQSATIYKNYEVLAHKAALAAYRLANDCQISSNGIINNSYQDIPCYYLETNLITKDNIQSQIIDADVYSEDDIYRNIGWLYE